MEEVFTAANTRLLPSFIWLHIMVIYEVWVWFSNKQWGKGTLPEPALQFIWKTKITNEIISALKCRFLKRKEKDFLKNVYSVNRLGNSLIH